jgi:hypothetical protein
MSPEAKAGNTDADRSKGEILISAGGGAVGGPLLQAAVAARSLSAARDRPWRLITGGNLPQSDFERLQATAEGFAPGGFLVERFRTDFKDLLARCRVSVSQGGYNTVLEILASRTPAVIVPFAEAGESEQTDRARLLHEKGLLRLLPAPEARCTKAGGGDRRRFCDGDPTLYHQSRWCPAIGRSYPRCLGKEGGVTGWGDLARECETWGASGRMATWWWRDDDAVSATPALDQLLGVAQGPIGLAVIPAKPAAGPRSAVAAKPGDRGAAARLSTPESCAGRRAQERVPGRAGQQASWTGPPHRVPKALRAFGSQFPARS